jgi:hypothetical protein
MRPDVIIIGDSHTAALRDGCAAVGLNAVLFYLSGNHWHMGAAAFHPVTGLHFAKRPALVRRMADIRASIGGGSVFSRDVPVIASFGYHLGRLAPPFGGWGHTPDASVFQDEPWRHFVSEGLLAAYIAHYRDNQIAILTRAAQLCPLVVVAPPMVQADAVAHAMACHITDRLQKAGVKVHDARAGRAYDGTILPPDLLSDDKVHGNAAYGEGVVRALIKNKLIQLPKAGVTVPV